ncbi:MAG: N-6 DNA methylase [Alphaproteobacteria bacterium]|nr:N-6 DNA methylase [Alphaproteobacteria bacterium]
MSQLLINQYLADLHRLRQVSGANRESVVREAFKDLLKAWGRSRDLQFIPEHEYITPTKDRRYIDGALLYGLRVPHGYWEAKDTNDDLDEEIARKFRRGYPQTNIIFEDSRTAVLIQSKQEVIRCAVDDVERLKQLLELFFGYERPEIADFRKAIEQFKHDLPAVLIALRERIDSAYSGNKDFADAALAFLKQSKETINPSVTDADVREMLIQHILTEDIFARIFGNDDFHRENNVAKALYGLERLFFRGTVKQETLHSLEPYYAAIRSTAALIQSHSEKQGFLKAIYENFYKVYNPLAADRLGVVYTPNEIVRFMVASADWLCERHFGKCLIDKNVEILDPATGTGTFIVELLEHFRGRPKEMKYKYQNELHANEVAILPYYVSNLNIEATYASIAGEYEEFQNLCFVDTLDNTAALKSHKSQQFDLLGGISSENADRIKRQNELKISVIIGNPPYNANQQSENDNNKNREYHDIDARIKATYIKKSEAQKTKLYDMYVRFLRWASDRIEEDGIVAFVSNSSFLHKHSFDGFRAITGDEFNELWVLDLKGDARSSGENRKRQGGNIFGDQIKVGIAIYFFVKKKGMKGLRIFYDAVRDYAKADEKVEFVSAPLRERRMTEIRPDGKHNWLNLSTMETDDFNAFLPIATKETKAIKVVGQERAIFKLYSLGISTNRDEWLYDHDKNALEKKVRFLIDGYNAVPFTAETFPDTIKWSRNLKRRLQNGHREAFSAKRITRASYRPYSHRWLYQSDVFTDELGMADEMFPPAGENRSISFSAPGARTNYCVLAIDGLADLHFGAAVDGYQQVTRFRFKDGERIDNITDWALNEFTQRYGDDTDITKDGIFSYVYAVLHDPVYQEKYAASLRREFPRIPFYSHFDCWRDWGEELLNLHMGYEEAAPFPLTRTDVPDKKVRPTGQPPKVILQSDHDSGIIVLDAETQLGGVPPAAWNYVLGNRCAIDWVLDQHKEKTPKDRTIREKFDSYRFADHKERVIELLKRVVAVSVKTVDIVEAMRAVAR